MLSWLRRTCIHQQLAMWSEFKMITERGKTLNLSFHRIRGSSLLPAAAADVWKRRKLYNWSRFHKLFQMRIYSSASGWVDAPHFPMLNRSDTGLPLAVGAPENDVDWRLVVNHHPLRPFDRRHCIISVRRTRGE